MSSGEAGPIIRRAQPSAFHRPAVGAASTTNLADLLERVLDKGIVIAGDVTLCLGGVEVLSLKIRLLIASLDRAQEVGIDWWRSDPFLSSRAKALEQEREGQKRLEERLERLEERSGLQAHREAQDTENSKKHYAKKAE